MCSVRDQIEASRVSVDTDVTIGANSFIRGEEVVLEKGVRVGDNVEIVCDKLELGTGCAIGSNSVILCPRIVCENGCSTGHSLEVALNEYFRLGPRSQIGNRVNIMGQGFKSGEFLWVESEVVIGGGGARGPHSYLTIGDRTSIFGRSYINLAEEVRIGSNTALSYNVVLLTHGAWQPALLGYPTKFGPIYVGHHVVIYLNSVVLPGVTIGDYSTVGAASLVLNDVPDHCLAVGNPARIRKGPDSYPPSLDDSEIDSLIRAILADYLTTLASKGVRIIHDFLAGENCVTVEFENQQETICYIPVGGQSPLHAKADITLSFGTVSAQCSGKCDFDLANEVVAGEPGRIAEDLRDYLRHRAIRIFTDKPFQSLPLANLRRLSLRMRGEQQ